MVINEMTDTCKECKEPPLVIIEEQRITDQGTIETDKTIYCKYRDYCPFLKMETRWKKEKKK